MGEEVALCVVPAAGKLIILDGKSYIISQIEPAGRLTGLGIRGRGGSYDVVLGERTETLGEVIAGLGRAQADGGEEEYEKVERSHGGHSEAGDFSSIYNLKSEISSSSSSCHCIY